MLVVIPLLSVKLQLHESTILILTCGLVAVSTAATAFVSTLVQFYIVQIGVGSLICVYAVARSLFTKSKHLSLRVNIKKG